MYINQIKSWHAQGFFAWKRKTKVYHYSMKTTKQLLYERKKYGKTGAYLCWLFGVHYIYFGKRWLFFLYLLTCGGFRVWAIIDIFRIPGMVETANMELQVKYWLDE